MLSAAATVSARDPLQRCKVSQNLMAAPPPNVGRPFLFVRRLDHTENDQDCRGQKAAEYRGVYDPLRYGHLLISGFLGGRAT